MERGIGVVGSRDLAESYREQVFRVVRYLLDSGYSIHSGGALGADFFALQAVISSGAYSRAQIFSAWSCPSCFPRAVQPYMEQYIRHSGRVIWGTVPPRAPRGAVVAGLLGRNQKLVNSSAGIVAFIHGDSRGTAHTVSRAIRRGIRVVAFPCGEGAVLPRVSGGIWRELRCGGCWAGAYIFRPDQRTAERPTLYGSAVRC